jgi:ABC-type sugar transport system, auxiliary component
MKRSEINLLMRDAVAFTEKMNFKLPDFAFWSPEEWQIKDHEFDEIRDNMLGWDITDFGSEDFYNVGLLLFTLRNGNLDLKKYKKTYAEKIMIVREGQVTPFHFHIKKMEDIINRGGGNLMVRLYNSTPDEKLADTPVPVYSDGKIYTVEAGGVLRLLPGESVTFFPEQFHTFWGEKGAGTVLVGEVSQVNDDRVDNCFLDGNGRFPQIEEDVKPLYYLLNEYPLSH